MTYTGNYTQAYVGDSATGVGYADFLLGQTQSWNAGVTPEYGGREKLPQIFVQDDYKIKPNLTLTWVCATRFRPVGVKSKATKPLLIRHADPTSNSLGAIWFGSTHANGRTHLQKPVYNTFLPRVGFAYQLTEDDA